jgi:hypothetical protein
VVTFAPHTCEEYPVNPKIVRGSSTLAVRIEKLPPLEGGIPQTRVTFMQQMDVHGGRIAAKLVKKFAAAQMDPLSTMRVRLDQSDKIDGDKRLEFEEMVRAHNQPYTAEELEVIKKGQDLHEIFEGEKGKVVTLPSTLASAKVVRKEGDSHAFGWATTTVRTR